MGTRRCHQPAPVIQASLVLGPARDRHEQEADRVAQQVVSSALRPAAPGSAAPGSAAPGSAAPGNAAPGNAAPGRVRRAVTALPGPGPHGGAVDPRVSRALAQARSGRPLPGPVRVPMEQALEADFRGVRLHTDEQADQLSRLLGARAFTTGQEIFFRRGEYHPQYRSGQRLLAHELTHVAQQTPAVRAADGACPASAAASPPASGAQVIQRMVFEVNGTSYDTETDSGLRRLTFQADYRMTRAEITAMLGQIEQHGQGRPGEEKLAGVLRARLLDPSLEPTIQPAARQPAPAVADAPSRGPERAPQPAGPSLVPETAPQRRTGQAPQPPAPRPPMSRRSRPGRALIRSRN